MGVCVQVIRSVMSRVWVHQYYLAAALTILEGAHRCVRWGAYLYHLGYHLGMVLVWGHYDHHVDSGQMLREKVFPQCSGDTRVQVVAYLLE